jgi:hypothetical protein
VFHSVTSRASALSLATAFASLAAAAFAGPAPIAGAVPNESYAAYAGTLYSAGNTGLLSNVTSPTNTESTSSSYVNVAGMTTKITVPTGKKALLVSRFSAETACEGTNGAECSIRILVDGHEAAPATDKLFAFSTVDPAAPATFMLQSNSMDRASEVGSGQHTVQVQEAVTDDSGNTIFWLGERSLTVESAIHP